MTKDEIIDLLTFARVYDARVTLGRSEAAAWALAVGRVPFAIAQQAVTEHYAAPIEPGAQYPRIAPGHVMAYYRAMNRPDATPAPPAIEGPKASPEFAAKMAEECRNLAAEVGARFALEDTDPDKTPRWRPGMDRQEFALKQAEASRRQRHAELDNLGGDAS